MSERYRRSEKSHAWLERILGERFGHEWRISSVEEGLGLTLSGAKGQIVFDSICESFDVAASDLPCSEWNANKEGWRSVIGESLPAPGVEELAKPLIEKSGVNHLVHYDILGLAYWMLARVEEVDRTDLDDHQRFSAASSHAFKHDYIERPVVDEWLKVLGQVMRRQWPGLELKRHQFAIELSHDVDSPGLYAFKSWPAIGRIMLGHLVKRRDPVEFFKTPLVKLSSRKALCRLDPHNTFDWLMDVSESRGLKSAFYFICGRSDELRDGEYDIDDPAIRKLILDIYRRGHEVGLHPSYNTFQDPKMLKQEADRLRIACSKLGVEQAEWGGRMHYLRWEQPTTLRAWANAGMSYDGTMGYADSPGFRCGTCYDYPAYDPVAQELLPLRIKPLITMECTVIDKVYLGLGVGRRSLEKMQKLKERCEQVNGVYRMLWHNSYFVEPGLKELYEAVLC